MKKSSIKRFLLLNLLLGMTVALFCAALGEYFLARADITKQFDLELQQSTAFVNHFMSAQDLLPSSSKTHETLQEAFRFHLNRIQLQVTDTKGHVRFRSNESFQLNPSSIKPGLVTQKINKTVWRIYTEKSEHLSMFISMGEDYSLRSQLEEAVIWHNLFINLLTYSLLALLIWIIVSRGLNTFQKIAEILSHRSSKNFEPLDISNPPIEIYPLIKELNLLLAKLKQEFENNKRFASDAAHELRTPLAALKTQTQVALLSGHFQPEQKKFLTQILKTIDRCIHIVQQLLILSRLSYESITQEFKAVNLYTISSEILSQLAPLAVEKNIDLALLDSEPNAIIFGNETILGVLIQNLVDNAIRYTPPHGIVETQIIKKQNQIILRVSDNGPGIPVHLRKRVFERFFRILGTKEQGSGLGLAIVKQIAELHHAIIHIDTPKTDQGLEIEVTFPCKP